jgi:anti-anti-sigma factor
MADENQGEPESKKFRQEGSKLTVFTDLETALAEEFRKRCERLLSDSEGDLLVDLSAVREMHSLAVGALTYLWVEASGHNREVTFVVSRHVAELFEKSGLGKILHYEVPGEEAASPEE